MYFSASILDMASTDFQTSKIATIILILVSLLMGKIYIVEQCLARKAFENGGSTLIIVSVKVLSQ